MYSIHFHRRASFGKIPPTLNNQSEGPPGGHTPPPPGSSRQNRAPHHGRRGVRLIRFNSSRGGRTASASIEARDSEKYPPHSTINRRVVQPAIPLPHPLRRVRTARHITGDAAYARFGLIRAGGVVQHPLPSSREFRKNTPHTQQSIGGSSRRPHPSPARFVASKPRATSRATRRTLDSV